MKIILFKQLLVYVTESGKRPFIEWLESLDDETRYRIKTRLDRVILGNLGDYKYIGSRVYEMRLSFGPGYRIYYGNDEDRVILLCGGDKGTQGKDIKAAIWYLTDYFRGDLCV